MGTIDIKTRIGYMSKGNRRVLIVFVDSYDTGQSLPPAMSFRAARTFWNSQRDSLGLF